MATATRGKKGTAPTVEARPPARRRRWLFSTTILLGLPALVWFAPAMIGFAPILNYVIRAATRDFQGTISVSSASLGWLSPIAIRDLEIHDAAGKPLAIVPLVSSQKRLLSLVTSLHDVGQFTVERPQIDIVVQDKGSNLEDAVSQLTVPKEDKGPPRQPFGISLVVNEGTVHIEDTVSGRQWQIEDFHCDVAVPGDPQEGLSVSAAGRVSPGAQPGRFSLRLKVVPSAASATAEQTTPPAEAFLSGSGEMALTAEFLPLELFEPLLRRGEKQGELAGVLNANITGLWNHNEGEAPRAELDGQIGVTRLVLVGPWAGDDRLRLENLQVPCSIVRNGERLEIRRCDIQSDFAQLSCSGSIDDLGQSGTSLVRSFWNALPHSDGEIKGTIDLARLARALPATLSVRPGLEIAEGAINVDLNSGIQNGVWACSGRMETTRIVAIEKGRQIAWEHPLLVTLVGHDSPQGPVIEQFAAASDFLKIDGSGTPDYFGLTANFELSRLTEELERFLELGQLRVAGDGWSRITWKRGTDDSFEANAELQANQFVLARPGKPPWNDERLVVTAAARGRLAGKALQQVDTASLQVASATDELSVTLQSPVVEIREGSVWPLEAQLHGELARWVARLEPWLGLPPGWDISGQADVVSTVNCATDAIDIERCQADFAQLHAWGPTLFLDEPRLRVTANGRVNLAKRTAQIKDATLTSPDISGHVQDAVFAPTTAAGIDHIGQADIQGNAATLYRWRQDPRQPANWQVSGLVACSLRADFSNSAPALDLVLSVDDLAAIPRSGQPWRERQVRLTANTTYDAQTDTVQLARLQLESDAVQFNATGRIDSWSKDRALAVSGKTDYDLEKITLLLQPYLNGGIRATGRESRSFSLAGPIGVALEPAAGQDPSLWLQQMKGKADFGWQSASLLGFNVAPGALEATLARGMLQVGPAKLGVSGGTVSIAPTMRLSPEPAELYMPAGKLVDRVQITPEMCEQWMMFVAPILAGVTKVEGSFSVQLAGCLVPLANPGAGDVAGQMVVHSIELEPGPLVQELAVLITKPTAVKLAQESQVDFRMVEGRVYHRGMKIQFPELTVQTYGSVGLDRSLAIMAEMNVPPKWIRDNALGAAVKDQVIRIPIGGTLDRPQLDRKALDDTLAQFVRGAAGGLLRNGLDQLDRLLAPPPRQR